LRVLAIGRPIGMLLSSPFRACVVDQIVVSVGPYIFRISPLTSRFRLAASPTGNASPPISNLRMELYGAPESDHSQSSLASDGVHCRCDTWRRVICAIMLLPSSCQTIWLLSNRFFSTSLVG